MEELLRQFARAAAQLIAAAAMLLIVYGAGKTSAASVKGLTALTGVTAAGYCLAAGAATATFSN